MSRVHLELLKSVLIAVIASLFLPVRLTSNAAGSQVDLLVEPLGQLKFTAKQDSEAMRSRGLIVKNVGKTQLDWSASVDQKWIQVIPSSGSLPENKDAPVDFAIDARGFSPGIYQATVRITAPEEQPRELTVALIVNSIFPGVIPVNAERTFPPDSGMANVKEQFGAKGDGVTDDTAAIQQAISATVHHPGLGARIIYFPAGTYLVSRPIVEKDQQGNWNSLLTLQGENRATTIIKLSDNNPAYQSATTPTDVLQFASQHGSPNGGGNSAFDNNIFDLTIDAGQGNPGAVALDFMGNNYCALRNVILQSSDPNHSGAAGLDMRRYATGPCLMKNVLINGFDYGIRTAHGEYSVTFEDLTLINQRAFGIFNSDNVLSIRHLFSRNSVPVICNQTGAGLITLLDAALQGGSESSAAILNRGTLYARNVYSSGYASVLQNHGQKLPGSTISEFDSGPSITQFGGKAESLKLPVEETPSFDTPDLSHWKSVISTGADPTGTRDSAAGIQAAIDSGAEVVYFPTGVYVISRPIRLGGKVRLIEGFGSSVNPEGERYQSASNPEAMFRIENGTADVTLDHLRIAAFYPHPLPGVIGILQDSSRAVVLRDSIIGAVPSAIAYQNTKQGNGTLFVENVTATPWRILFPQKVFARQINPEGNATKIVNNGGQMWILGLKTEGTGTNIETTSGGWTEVVGGLIYPVWRVPADTPAFTITDSRASFIYAVSNYKMPFAATNFELQVTETQRGIAKSLHTTSLPPRGRGTTVPLYTSSD